jgi:His-Xaa-Ser system protein HxsD
MGAAEDIQSLSPEKRAVLKLDSALFSEESILKACYWLAHDYCCEINKDAAGAIEVTLTVRDQGQASDLALAKEAFIQSVEDFELREKINAKTSGIRDLLLAKAFSESGVLEDSPQGVFGDRIENEKPNGMFKILGNS